MATHHRQLNELVHAIYERAEEITHLLDDKFDLTDSDLRSIERKADDIRMFVGNYSRLNNR